MLYEKGKIYDYPCGCKFSIDEEGYIHYCNPACKYDCDKPGKALKGYRYVGWQSITEDGLGLKRWSRR